MVKSFDDLLKENAFTAMKILDDIGDPSCPSSNDDILSSTGHHIQSHNVSLLSIPLFFFFKYFLKNKPILSSFMFIQNPPINRVR